MRSCVKTQLLTISLQFIKLNFKKLKEGSIRDLIIHFIPAIIVIMAFEAIAIQVYAHAPIEQSKFIL